MHTSSGRRSGSAASAASPSPTATTSMPRLVRWEVTFLRSVGSSSTNITSGRFIEIAEIVIGKIRDRECKVVRHSVIATKAEPPERIRLAGALAGQNDGDGFQDQV